MSMIDRLVDKLIKQGKPHPARCPGKPSRTFGPGGGKGRSPSASWTARWASTSSRNPRLGLGATFHGRPTGYRGCQRPRPSSEVVVGSNRWEDAGGPEGAQGGQGHALKRLLQAKHPAAGAPQRRPPLRSPRAALPPPPRPRHAIYLRLSHRAPQQPRPGAARQEGAHRRQARARSPRPRVLDIGSGWGGMALDLDTRRRRRSARSHFVPSTSSRFHASAPQAAGAADQCQV